MEIVYYATREKKIHFETVKCIFLPLILGSTILSIKGNHKISVVLDPNRGLPCYITLTLFFLLAGQKVHFFAQIRFLTPKWKKNRMKHGNSIFAIRLQKVYF